MHVWISRQYREHKWLTIAMGAYLALGALELTRVVLFDRPTTYDAGFHAWEETEAPSEPGTTMRFHWSRAEGAMLRPVDGAVLNLMLYETHPRIPEEGIPVTLEVGDQVIDEFRILRNGWHSLEYYLPPILGADAWSQVEAGWVERARTEAAVAGGGWFARWQELKPWHRRAGPPSIWIRIEVGSTFVPSELLETDDARTLGVGVTDAHWQSGLPPEGIGFHPWELDAEGVPFRWTRSWASQPLDVAGTEAHFNLLASNPDLDQTPVSVQIFWDERPVAEIDLRDRSWAAVNLSAADLGRELGVLSFHVDRTWSPAVAGISADARQLGIAVTEIEWR